MRRTRADKKFEQAMFAAYRKEGWADETLMAAIQNRTYATLRRLVKMEQARPIDHWGDEMLKAGHHHAVIAILAAMDRWKKGVT